MDGFGNTHEIPAHAGIGYGDRPARGNLALEYSDYTAVAGQHVSKPDRNERAVTSPSSKRHGGDDDFSDALRHPHDAGRVDRLVGGNHQESPNLIGMGRTHDIPGADNVVLRRFHNVRFHQRHVFVGRRMENGFDVITRHGIMHALIAGDIAYHRHQVERWKTLPQFQRKHEHLAFGLIEYDKPARVETSQLPAKFGTYRAAAARYNDALAGDVLADCILFHTDRI